MIAAAPLATAARLRHRAARLAGLTRDHRRGQEACRRARLCRQVGGDRTQAVLIDGRSLAFGPAMIDPDGDPRPDAYPDAPEILIAQAGPRPYPYVPGPPR